MTYDNDTQSAEGSETSAKRKKILTDKTLFENFDEDPPEPITEETERKCCSMLRFGKGIVEDFKRTVGTNWRKEMSNFNQKTIAVSFFLFFACIAPAITFGAIYSKVTHNYIGPVEMIAATAWCGIFYSLVGGMPIVSFF